MDIKQGLFCLVIDDAMCQTSEIYIIVITILVSANLETYTFIPVLKTLFLLFITGVSIDDVDADTVMPTTKKKILNDEEQYNEDIRFNIAIRETFLNRFVHMFLMYENFVIMPDQVNI